MQLVIGTLMYWISSNVQVLLDDVGSFEIVSHRPLTVE